MLGLTQLLHKDNEIFGLARRGRRLPNILVAILALLGILVVVLIPLSIAAKLIYGNAEVLDELWGGLFFLIVPFLLMNQGVFRCCLVMRILELNTPMLQCLAVSC